LAIDNCLFLLHIYNQQKNTMKKMTLFLLQAIITIAALAQNVGIGTTTPVNKLEVVSTGSAIARFSGGNAMYITLAEGVNNRGYIGSFLGNAEDIDFGTYSGNNTGSLHLATLATPRLSVLPNGNVGIGTINPEQLFSVAGGMVVDQNDLNTGMPIDILRFGKSSGEGIGSKRNTGSGQKSLDFYTDSTIRLTISNIGNVGIGAIQAKSKLQIYNHMLYYERSAYEQHALSLWDSAYGMGNTILFMGTDAVNNVGYINCEEIGNISPYRSTLLLNTNGNGVGIGNIKDIRDYRFAVDGNAMMEGRLWVRHDKGIIRNTTIAQLKQVVTSVNISPGTINAGSTILQGITWSESFSAAPVAAYVGNVTAFTTGGWAELIMTIYNAGTNGCVLYIYNPKNVSVSPGFTINLVAIGAD
jgi:hypothetical protein